MAKAKEKRTAKMFLVDKAETLWQTLNMTSGYLQQLSDCGLIAESEALKFQDKIEEINKALAGAK